MPALSKIAKGALSDLTDAYKKTFAPETYYHGTVVPDIKKFDPNAESPRSGFDESGATFFSKSKDEASNYMRDLYEGYSGQVPTTYEVKIKTSNIFDPKNEDHLKKIYEKQNINKNYDDFVYSVEESMERAHLGEPDYNFYEILKSSGFRGFKPTDSEVGLFYPDQGDVRSIHAKFDPAKEKSGNILASVPAAALTGYGALEAINGQSID